MAMVALAAGLFGGPEDDPIKVKKQAKNEKCAPAPALMLDRRRRPRGRAGQAPGTPTLKHNARV